MILSNNEILKAVKAGDIRIGALTGDEPSSVPPFNTTSIDLCLGDTVSIPKDGPAAFDMRKKGIAQFLSDHSEKYKITESQPFNLKPQTFVLANTRERVHFPIRPDRPSYAARVEGRSSVSRCGILVHFTAPTIHAGFEGTITLEIISLGPLSFLLCPGMPICQLIIEQVHGVVTPAENPQFRGQSTPAGL